MKTVYIYHHLGLGDHITANGMVRTIIKNYDRGFLFCKPSNFRNVSYMYRDLQNLRIIKMDDSQVRSFMAINPDHNYIIAGHAPFWKILNSPGNKKDIQEIFYELAGVPFENKWSEFYIQRDLDREKEVFKKLGLREWDKYAFVHDDPSRRISKEIPQMKIVRPENRDFSPFDFLYTIENAQEIHCINSSFYCLIEHIGIDKDQMYIHEYVRNDLNEDARGIFRSNWKILK